jgi:hypothetical protein
MLCYTIYYYYTDARKVGRAAEMYRKSKADKYDGPCAANGLKFVPLIFESTGRMDKSCHDFLRTALKQKHRENTVQHRAFSNYWLCRISCTLQKAISTAIVNRSKIANTGMVHNSNYQFQEAFILESEFRY